MRLHPRYDPAACKELGEQHAIVGLLVDGLGVEDGPRQELVSVGHREQHLAVKAPVLLGVDDPNLFLCMVCTGGKTDEDMIFRM